MAEKVVIILIEEKNIRGKVKEPGTVLMRGKCSSGIKGSDIDKAIQLGQARVRIEEKGFKDPEE